MDDPYLAVLRRWMTAEELDQVRKGLGSAEDIVDRAKQMERLIEKAEQREELWKFLKMVGLAFSSIVGLLAVLKGLIPAEWLP